jgi:peroxiredoxin-like protein
VSPNYQFHTTAYWTAARNGIAESESSTRIIDFSAPPEFQGQPGQWTPEHLLLAAVSACFITTFRAIAEISKFEAAGLAVAVTGRVTRAEDGFRFTEILLQPELTIHGDADRSQAVRLLEKAERSCLVSKSLRSEVRMEPAIRVLEAAQNPAA